MCAVAFKGVCSVMLSSLWTSIEVMLAVRNKESRQCYLRYWIVMATI